MHSHHRGVKSRESKLKEERKNSRFEGNQDSLPKNFKESFETAAAIGAVPAVASGTEQLMEGFCAILSSCLEQSPLVDRYRYTIFSQGKFLLGRKLILERTFKDMRLKVCSSFNKNRREASFRKYVLLRRVGDGTIFMGSILSEGNGIMQLREVLEGGDSESWKRAYGGLLNALPNAELYGRTDKFFPLQLQIMDGHYQRSCDEIASGFSQVFADDLKGFSTKFQDLELSWHIQSCPESMRQDIESLLERFVESPDLRVRVGAVSRTQIDGFDFRVAEGCIVRVYPKQSDAIRIEAVFDRDFFEKSVLEFRQNSIYRQIDICVSYARERLKVLSNARSKPLYELSREEALLAISNAVSKGTLPEVVRRLKLGRGNLTVASAEKNLYRNVRLLFDQGILTKGEKDKIYRLAPEYRLLCADDHFVQEMLQTIQQPQ